MEACQVATLRVEVARFGRRDIGAIVEWTFEKFGEAAARRYHALILQALRDIGLDPELLGSKHCPESNFAA